MQPLINCIEICRSESPALRLKSEIESLPFGILPLEKAVTQGGRVEDSRITASVLDMIETAASFRAKVGIFFEEIIGGCSCGEEPFAQNAYCEIHVVVDKVTGKADFSLIQQ